MAWTQHIDWTPEEEDALDAALVELGYATADDLAEERSVEFNVEPSPDDAQDDDSGIAWPEDTPRAPRE